MRGLNLQYECFCSLKWQPPAMNRERYRPRATVLCDGKTFIDDRLRYFRRLAQVLNPVGATHQRQRCHPLQKNLVRWCGVHANADNADFYNTLVSAEHGVAFVRLWSRGPVQ